jgi:predicted Holliday junction resolvase-like endonuclease
VKSDLVTFYRIQRNIFGVCPRSGDLFRLSDCKVYLRARPTKDWMDDLERQQELLSRKEEKLDEREEELREAARVKGRKRALQVIKRVDPVFTPRKLNPDDAKVLFHPIDYLVFNGMKSGAVSNLILLDRKGATKQRIGVQNSVEKVIERGNYEWRTLRVEDDGTVKEQE